MVLYSLAVIIFSGLLFGKIIKIFKLPQVTGYLIAGVIIGPFCLKLITFDNINSLELFSTVALSFISFLIGTELKMKYLKKLGSKPLIIALFCSITTFVITILGLSLLKCDLKLAIILGAIASSTAPASIMMVVKQYHAKGEVTSNLMGIIAIDDAISIIIFGFSMVFVESLSGNSLSLINWLEPFKEILLSIVLGSGLGLILGFFEKYFKSNSNNIALVFAFVITMIVVTNYYNISSLLACMILGFVFVNSFNNKLTNHIIDLTDNLTPILFLIFFVVSGASLDFSILKDVGILGIGYIVFRTLGKIIGANIGTRVVNSSKNVKKYLGFNLLSQTGLAIGLAVIAVPILKDLGDDLITIIIASSFIFDIFGPIIVKVVLRKAKEIK